VKSVNLPALVRFAVTALAVLLAALVARALWGHYMYSPWTRDGRVRAEIVHIAPDISGLVVQLKVIDNSTVKKGDVLFVIDRIRFSNAVDQAAANLNAARAAADGASANTSAAVAAVAQSRSSYEMYLAQSKRREELHEVISAEDRTNAESMATSARAALLRAQATQEQAIASEHQARAAVVQSQVALAAAQINLERTEVRAPVDGYVTNLNVRVGDFASAGVARMALIDSHSYWVYGYFEETKLPQVRIGDPVDIRLMSGGAHLQGTVESIARGITDADNPMGADLLADVNPTFNWVRLAQRLPVRVRIDTQHIPIGTVLWAGMTATLIVHPHRVARPNGTAS
jgi:multidrug resistance efflux pump